MRKLLFIGLVIIFVVLISGCYGPGPSGTNATVQPTSMVTAIPYTPYAEGTVIPAMTSTTTGTSTVTMTPTTPVTTTPTTTAVSTVTGTAIVSGTVATVNVTRTGFVPATISVPSGTTVTWTNTDTISHTVSSNTGAFDLNLDGGQSLSHTFITPGSYDYRDRNNASMIGTVVVTS